VDERAEDLIVIQLPGGEVVIELLPEIAPLHAERLRELARSGEYDNVAFHRVIDGFVAQAGDVEFADVGEGYDPSRVGTGSSGLPNLPAEFSGIAFQRGIVGMARVSDPLGVPERQEFLDSADSQFFIVLEDAFNLNGRFTALGFVAKGMDVVDQLTRGTLANGVVADPAQNVMQNVEVAADSEEPVALDDVMQIAQFSTAIDIDVLGDDVDPEGGALQVIGVTAPAVAGSGVRLNDDGTIDYAPRSDLTGLDSFDYLIEDEQGNQSSATVQIVANAIDPDLVCARIIAYMYEAAFGRFPDVDGLNFWIGNAVDGRIDKEGVAFGLIESPEFMDLFGDLDALTNQQYVDLLFSNILGREPDPEGSEFWVNLLNTNPNFSRGDALASISESPENQLGSPNILLLTETSPGVWEFPGLEA